MKTDFCLSLIVSTILILATDHTVNGQPANSTIANIINEKYTKSYTMDPETNTIYEEPQFITPVDVNYESPSTVLISGELINSIDGNNTFNAQLWEAMDLLKNQYGFKLQNVMTSGAGSVGNPTTVYILMTK